MTQKQRIRSVLTGLATIFIVAAVVMSVRYFWMASFLVSTDAMEEALHKGDYILVNKLQGKNNPGRNRIVLFTSPLLKDSVQAPLFLSRCIGMPGDTIRISGDGFSVNGKQIPRSPHSLSAYFITQDIKEEFLRTLEKLKIPEREVRKENFGLSLTLTSFEEYQIREELTEQANLHFVHEQKGSYTLVVPRKDRAYRLDAAALLACKEAIMTETGGKAIFRNGKLFLDGCETSFFFFKQDYYWVLSDNTIDAVDSRHLGFIPAEHMIGNAWFCWFSTDKQRIFKLVH